MDIVKFLDPNQQRVYILEYQCLTESKVKLVDFQIKGEGQRLYAYQRGIWSNCLTPSGYHKRQLYIV